MGRSRPTYRERARALRDCGSCLGPTATRRKRFCSDVGCIRRQCESETKHLPGAATPSSASTPLGVTPFRVELHDRETMPRFDRAIARWHARFVLESQGITADEAALALTALKALAGLKTRELAAETLRRLATTYGLDAVVQPPR